MILEISVPANQTTLMTANEAASVTGGAAAAGAPDHRCGPSRQSREAARQGEAPCTKGSCRPQTCARDGGRAYASEPTRGGGDVDPIAATVDDSCRHGCGRRSASGSGGSFRAQTGDQGPVRRFQYAPSRPPNA